MLPACIFSQPVMLDRTSSFVHVFRAHHADVSAVGRFRRTSKHRVSKNIFENLVSDFSFSKIRELLVLSEVTKVFVLMQPVYFCAAEGNKRGASLQS